MLVSQFRSGRMLPEDAARGLASIIRSQSSRPAISLQAVAAADLYRLLALPADPGFAVLAAVNSETQAKVLALWATANSHSGVAFRSAALAALCSLDARVTATGNLGDTAIHGDLRRVLSDEELTLLEGLEHALARDSTEQNIIEGELSRVDVNENSLIARVRRYLSQAP